jgi:energy-coupling factor transport system substrate-specific component
MRATASSLSLALIPVGIAANILIGELIRLLAVPVYLDSIGTVLVGVLLGPWMGAFTGALTNMIWGLSGISPGVEWYLPVAVAIGLLSGVAARVGLFRSPWSAALTGLGTGLVAAILSAPITAYVLEGQTGNSTDAIVAFFERAGATLINATFGQSIVSDPLDKLATFLLVWLLTRLLPRPLLLRFPNADVARPSAGQ